MGSLAIRTLAEALGTALLLFVIVGSGIAVTELSSDSATQLFVHAVAVGLGLGALIAVLGPTSGAHFNPAVTLGFWLTGAIAKPVAAFYALAQVAGAVAGVGLANLTFDQDLFVVSERVRGGIGRPVAEVVATFVLVLVILGLVRTGRVAAVAPAVGAWVAAAIVSTPSTGFANPAVTVGRILTDTYTGIAPESVPAFVVAQLVAAVMAAGAAVAFFRPPDAVAGDGPLRAES